METITEEISKAIECRKKNHKKAAYVDLPDDITVDEIKWIQSRVNSDNIGCRLYTTTKLQIYWDNGITKNVHEKLLDIPAINNIDSQMIIFKGEKFERTNEGIKVFRGTGNCESVHFIYL